MDPSGCRSGSSPTEVGNIGSESQAELHSVLAILPT